MIGDRWTLVIMRELTMGNRRFDTLQVQPLASPQMLTNRLKRLEADGMIERRAYSVKPRRYGYYLAAKGEAFASVLLACGHGARRGARSPGKGLPSIRSTQHAVARWA